MPPKRNTTEKKQQATVQGTEEIQTGSGGHGLGLGPGLPASKPQFLETVLEGLTNKFSLVMDSKLSSLDVKITKHLSSIEANVAVLKGEIVDLQERQVESSNITEDLVARVDGLEQQVLEQENKVKSLENTLDDLKNRQVRKTLVFGGFPEGCEGQDSWDNCKSFLTTFITDLKLDLNVAVEIERAHRGSKKSENNGSAKPRPIYAQFLRWSDANAVLQSGTTALIKSPYIMGGKKVPIFIDQMVTPKIREMQNSSMNIRKYLRSVHQDWKIYVRDPADIMYKSSTMKDYRKLHITDSIASETESYINGLS